MYSTFKLFEKLSFTFNKLNTYDSNCNKFVLFFQIHDQRPQKLIASKFQVISTVVEF